MAKLSRIMDGFSASTLPRSSGVGNLFASLGCCLKIWVIQFSPPATRIINSAACCTCSIRVGKPQNCDLLYNCLLISWSQCARKCGCAPFNLFRNVEYGIINTLSASRSDIITALIGLSAFRIVSACLAHAFEVSSLNQTRAISSCKLVVYIH